MSSIDKEKSKFLKKPFIAIFIIILAVLSSFITFFVLQYSLNTPIPVVVVSSGSMKPTINEGDILFVKGVDGNEISEGDVIVFQALWIGAPSEPVVHRVIEIINESGVLEFYTKGDNNEGNDPGFRTINDIYGRVIGRIPYIGWIKLFFDRSGLLIPLIVIIVIFLVISMLWDYSKEKNEKNKQERKISQEDFDDHAKLLW